MGKKDDKKARDDQDRFSSRQEQHSSRSGPGPTPSLRHSRDDQDRFSSRQEQHSSRSGPGQQPMRDSGPSQQQMHDTRVPQVQHSSTGNCTFIQLQKSL
jgi:hypothetical protein